MRLRAVVEYDGTDYHGFQAQPDKETIQGTIEAALQHLTREGVRVVGAGRTDAGVHAIGQVIHFDTEWRHSLEEMRKGLDALLPKDVAVRVLEQAPEGFHARHSAVSRTYRYLILNQRIRSPMQERYMCRVSPPLDLAAMQESSSCLVGTRDFSAFGQATVGSRTVRTVHRVRWSCECRLPSWLQGCLAGSDEEGGRSRIARLEIEANGYLRGMVRRLVGTMLRVGTGKLSPKGFREILGSADIGRAAPPASACGLCLAHVKY